MKKLLVFAMAAAMLLSLAACGGASSAAPAASSAAPAAAVEGLKEPIAEQPALLTSVGQSADYEMVKVMLDKNSISYSTKSLATPDDLGDAKTLILAIGGSSKGLGAAGIDADQEIARVDTLVKAAQEKGLTIIALHIGGEARRGDLSDKFIAPCFNVADYALVVAEGDKDGLLTKLASENEIPMDTVASMGEVVGPLKAAFK